MKIHRLLFFLCGILLSASAASAATVPVAQGKYFAVGGTSVSTNVAYAIAPGVGGVARIETIIAKDDSSAGTLRFFTAGPPIYVTNSLAAGLSNIFLNPVGTGLTNGDSLVIHSIASNLWQRVLVATTNSAGVLITNTLSAATTAFALSPGDTVYRMNLAASVLIGNTATTLTSGNGGAVWSSLNNRPALIELVALSGSTTNHALAISGLIARDDR